MARRSADEWHADCLRRLSSRLPRIGYLLAFAVCWALSYWRVWTWEWRWFVLLPFLLGLSHLLAPREYLRWKPYLALSVTWLAAALLGVLAHWGALNAYTPWLSLARYLAIAAAGALVLAAPQLIGPHSAPPASSLRRWSVTCLAWLSAVAWLALVAVVAVNTPFRLALAPRYPGLKAERLSAAPSGRSVVRMAWSPDSRSLAVMVDRSGVWLIQVPEGSASLVADRGRISRQPWLADASGLLIAKDEDGDSRLWFVSKDGSKRRPIIEDVEVGYACVAPGGDLIAFVTHGDIWLSDKDGGHRRRLVRDAVFPTWSPDGRHIAFSTLPDRAEEPTGASVRITDLHGLPQAAQVDAAHAHEFAWVSPGSYAACALDSDWGESKLASWWDYCGHITIQLCNLDGSIREVMESKLPLGGFMVSLAAQPGGRLLAFAPDALWPAQELLEWQRGFVVGAVSGRIWKLPRECHSVLSMAWSPDGRSLAIERSGTQVTGEIEAGGGENRSEVWLISGF